jgi:hypothetical protein
MILAGDIEACDVLPIAAIESNATVDAVSKPGCFSNKQRYCMTHTLTKTWKSVNNG